MSFGKPETEEVEEEEELSPGMLQIMATLDQQEKRFVTSPLFPFPQEGGWWCSWLRGSRLNSERDAFLCHVAVHKRMGNIILVF